MQQQQGTLALALGVKSFLKEHFFLIHIYFHRDLIAFTSYIVLESSICLEVSGIRE
jgi:hypothetical protein